MFAVYTIGNDLFRYSVVLMCGPCSFQYIYVLMVLCFIGLSDDMVRLMGMIIVLSIASHIPSAMVCHDIAVVLNARFVVAPLRQRG